MAEVLYGLNDAEDVKRWSMELTRETIPMTLSQRWASTSGTTPLHIKTELSQAAGSTIDFFLRVKSVQAGVRGDDELEGKEEGMTTHKDTITIDQLRSGHKSGGRMSEQRVTWKVRAELKDLAADWWSERLDTWFFNLACGNTVEIDSRFAGLHAAPTAPTTGRIFRAGGVANDESITSTEILDTDLIDKAVNQAKITEPQIRPVKVDGGEYYICVLHPNVVRELRDSSTRWYGDMRAAMQGGAINNNPIFTGALGASNGCVFFESNYVTNGVSTATGLAVTDVKRNVLLGAQSVVMGFGQEYGPGQFDWVEQALDYGNKVGVAVGLISGMKKTIFNSADYGTIVLPSYGKDPA